MIEVIRHTTDLKQFASSLYMDSSIILPDALYATTTNVPRPNTIHEDIKNTGALFQIPFKCDPGMADMKTEGKRFIKKQKHGSKLISL
ncbi:unnamed protein product [Onchocerca flexuosa]|uniref:Uncharacterized protein n=1 Tax=Onchocerca flexuosa TaxID=387005 RepID=A0A183I5G5_9BILA|nr:unnamed protein product [Onchocerca flexuosa]